MVTTLRQLRRAFLNAKKYGADEFRHDDKQFITAYAGYLVEYLDFKNYPQDKPIEFTQNAGVLKQ